MWSSDDTFAAVRTAELALLSPAVRADKASLAGLLADDFAEIGRSGHRWERPDLVAALVTETPRAAPATSEWLFNEVAENLVLVTYRVHGADHDSRHSSLWQVADTGPVLRFHQGTVVTDR